MTDVPQKRALLLHTAGMDIQDIFFTLETVEENTDDDYVKAIKHSMPILNHRQMFPMRDMSSEICHKNHQKLLNNILPG